MVYLKKEEIAKSSSIVMDKGAFTLKINFYKDLGSESLEMTDHVFVPILNGGTCIQS